MIAIVDYGVGNLFSLKSSLSMIGADVVVTGDKDEIKKADKIILPGVGAFRDALLKLKKNDLFSLIKEEAEKGKEILGICLGMQLLFEKSYEDGEYEGLGLIKGEVKPLRDVIDKNLKVPHIGWNKLKIKGERSKIFKYIGDEEFVYFVHSYYGADCDSVTATTDYSIDVTASVGKSNVYGCQFHPEKSGEVGLKILKAFCEDA